jgi:hypothetical protein
MNLDENLIFMQKLNKYQTKLATNPTNYVYLQKALYYKGLLGGKLTPEQKAAAAQVAKAAKEAKATQAKAKKDEESIKKEKIKKANLVKKREITDDTTIDVLKEQQIGTGNNKVRDLVKISKKSKYYEFTSLIDKNTIIYGILLEYLYNNKVLLLIKKVNSKYTTIGHIKAGVADKEIKIENNIRIIFDTREKPLTIYLFDDSLNETRGEDFWGLGDKDGKISIFRKHQNKVS